jgi:hypothetical protein
MEVEEVPQQIAKATSVLYWFLSHVSTVQKVERKACSSCKTRDSSITCLQCSEVVSSSLLFNALFWMKTGTQYCFDCSLRVHRSLPKDVNPHVPDVIDQGPSLALQCIAHLLSQDLMNIQRADVEDKELKLEVDCIKACSEVIKGNFCPFLQNMEHIWLQNWEKY